MRELGWSPSKDVRKRIAEVVTWTLANDRWLKI
jgi:dTDP-D-glucose 4,6-dehydratase